MTEPIESEGANENSSIDRKLNFDAIVVSIAFGVVVGFPIGLSSSPVVPVLLPLIFGAASAVGAYLFAKYPNDQPSRPGDWPKIRHAIAVGIAYAALASVLALTVGGFLRTGRFMPQEIESPLIGWVSELKCAELAVLVSEGSDSINGELVLDPLWSERLQNCESNESRKQLSTELLKAVLKNSHTSLQSDMTLAGNQTNGAVSKNEPNLVTFPEISAGVSLPSAPGKSYRAVVSENGQLVITFVAASDVAKISERTESGEFEDCVKRFVTLLGDPPALDLNMSLQDQLPIRLTDDELRSLEESHQKLRDLKLRWARRTILDVCTDQNEESE